MRRKTTYVLKHAVLGACAVMVWCASAGAADQVELPYRCEAAGGDVRLTPSEPRRYGIYGRREQDIVTACAPDNPGRCRTWRLHRFDMNCGGTRVPWIDVVSAANILTRGPAKVRQGRLYVRMDPWWAKRRPPAWDDRPQLREFDDGVSRQERFRTPPQDTSPQDTSPQDWDYQSEARAPTVEMPPGFAPVVGFKARFVDGPPGTPGTPSTPGTEDAAMARGTGAAAPLNQPAPPLVAQAPPPRPTAAPSTVAPAVDPVAPPPGRTVIRDHGHTFEPKTAQTKSTETKSADLKPSPVAKPLGDPLADKSVAAGQPAVPVIPPPAKAPTPQTIAPGAIVAPTILNRPGAEPTAITAATSSSGDNSGGDTAASSDQSLPIALQAAPGASAARAWPVVLSIATLALLATAGVFYLRRQSEAGAAATDRDLASVSLDAAGLSNAAPSRALVPAHPASPAAEPQSPPPPPPQTLAQALLSQAPPVETFITSPVSAPEWLPATRDEALQVLGAGPDASDAVLKKIVDGLRMSWHPDHAKTAQDFALRSERMTQINVAWDILSGRQSLV